MKLFKLFSSSSKAQTPVRDRLERILAEPVYRTAPQPLRIDR